MHIIINIGSLIFFAVLATLRTGRFASFFFYPRKIYRCLELQQPGLSESPYNFIMRACGTKSGFLQTRLKRRGKEKKYAPLGLSRQGHGGIHIRAKTIVVNRGGLIIDVTPLRTTSTGGGPVWRTHTTIVRFAINDRRQSHRPSFKTIITFSYGFFFTFPLE